MRQKQNSNEIDSSIIRSTCNSFQKNSGRISLSFGKGLLQALQEHDFLSGAASYLGKDFFYGMIVNKNQTENNYFFCPPLNALGCLQLSGEFHPRTCIYCAEGKEIAEVNGLFGTFVFATHASLCYIPEDQKNKNTITNLKSFCNHTEWMVLKNSIPLKNQTPYYSILLTQLINLFKEELDKQASRKEEYIHVLNSVKAYLSHTENALAENNQELKEIKTNGKRVKINFLSLQKKLLYQKMSDYIKRFMTHLSRK